MSAGSPLSPADSRLSPADPPRSAAVARLPLIAAALVAVAVAGGQLLAASGVQLGVPLPPFQAHLRPLVSPLMLPCAAVLAGATLLAPRLVARPQSPLFMVLALSGLSLLVGMSTNLARSGVHGLWAVFDTGRGGSHEAANEYLPGLWALRHGVQAYIHHFPSLIPVLPVHVRGNPPGPLVALHLLGINRAEALAALCIGLGSLCAPLSYVLGRTLGGERRGVTAGVLCAFSPALALLGVTSVDYVFAALGMACACLLLSPKPVGRAGGAALVPVAAFSSWLLLAIPAWAVLQTWLHRGRRPALLLGGSVALALALGWLLGTLWLGYDPTATLAATEKAYRHGISAQRPYAYWLLGSPAAWVIALGLPVAWALARAVSVRDPAALALAALVISAAVLGFTKAETERIWLPFVPLACVAAARALPARRLAPALWLLTGQALLVSLLIDTTW